MRFILAKLAVAVVLAAAPVPGDLPKDSRIDGPTNWGTVSWAGKRIAVEGHECWEAAGYVRDDGKVFLIWTFRSDGRPAPGLYEFKDGGLNGEWGWATDVQIGEDGMLTGDLHTDRIYRTK